MKTQNPTPAVLWQNEKENTIRCKLCSHRCLIPEDKLGFCSVRKNINSQLYSLNYDKVCAANPDPIEKKPLFHFQPGTQSFSIACIGCNFRCSFCQNWQISQAPINGTGIDGQPISPQQIIKSALAANCSSIAYTYTEPTIFMELCNDCGILAKENGLSNVFVSNGYETKEAVDFAKNWLDGINIDLKAFTDDYYKKLCKARLQPVLDTIKYIAQETNIWMEITTLIIPGENDSNDELKQIADFIVNSAGPDTPWHISRFFPQYKYDKAPPTPLKTLENAAEIGRSAGLRYIYIGNIPSDQYQNTFCYKCGSLLIERTGYTVLSNNLKNSRCPDCDSHIAGYQL
ncbi:MAG: AmmeMemoRadiSam system radical SAM enzyme [Phycisphaerae bacterium]|nr:AmmeMemoRadiSam system radical SAM enzyme [Phycisphaerae bacterium]